MSGPDRIDAEAEIWWGRMHGDEARAYRSAFEAWRAADPLHQAAYAKLDATWDVAAGLGETDMGRNRTLEAMPRAMPWVTGPRLAIAASLALIIAVAIGLASAGGDNPVIAVAQATTIGQIKQVRLTDGSIVTLDTNSRLLVQFDEKERRLTLQQGRARFDVQPDPKRHFRVTAGGKIVTTDNASFDVQLQSKGLAVSTLRGSVEIKAAIAPIATAATADVPEGQTVRVVADGGAAPAVASDQGSDQWVNGMLVYHGTPLAAVLAETNRYTSHPITLADSSLGNLKVTGVFRPLPVDNLAASLAAALDLKVRKAPGGSLVLARR